jgi:hypothetical protein
MLTDGFIGNESQIIEEVGRRAGDRIRFWALGIGSSPNRFLLDGVAKMGGGMSAVIELKTDPTELVTQIVERIHRAQLAEIQIDWNGLSVYETYPRKIPELWAGRPVILFGRYGDGGSTTIELSGLAEGELISYALDVTLPSEERQHGVLSKVWARNKIEDLSSQMFYGDTPEVVEEITEIALDYRLMTQYTSFVAVDESEVPQIGVELTPPRRVVIPVPLPEGVSFEGVFGPLGEEEAIAQDRLDHPVPYKSVPSMKLKGYRTARQHKGRVQLNAPAAQSARKMAAGRPYQMRREAAASSVAGGGGLYSMSEAKNGQRFALPKEAQLSSKIETSLVVWPPPSSETGLRCATKRQRKPSQKHKNCTRRGNSNLPCSGFSMHWCSKPDFSRSVLGATTARQVLRQVQFEHSWGKLSENEHKTRRILAGNSIS